MGSVYYKQPNGRYCRYSTVVDCVTHYNMTEDDILELCIQNAIHEAIITGRRYMDDESHFHSFEELVAKYEDPEELDEDGTAFGEMTIEQFASIKEEMTKPVDWSTHCIIV